MKGKIFGYGRVSSSQQNEERKIKALLEYGIQEQFIFIDKEYIGIPFDNDNN